jgi:hypothetical protein
MKDPFRKHNEKVRAGNTPPTPIPDPVDDLQTLIAEYNAIEKEQEARLARLWSSMAAREGSTRFVSFGDGARWTTNDFRAGERPDICMGAALRGLTALITDFNLGE